MPDATFQIPALMKPRTDIPMLAPVEKPAVLVGDEFPSLGWWWRVESVDPLRGSMKIMPVRPTNKAKKLANGGR